MNSLVVFGIPSGILHLAPKLVVLLVLLNQTLVHPGARLAAGAQDEVSGAVIADPDQLVAHAHYVNLDLEKKNVVLVKKCNEWIRKRNMPNVFLIKMKKTVISNI